MCKLYQEGRISEYRQKWHEAARVVVLRTVSSHDGCVREQRKNSFLFDEIGCESFRGSISTWHSKLKSTKDSDLVCPRKSGNSVRERKFHLEEIPLT